MYKFWMNLLQRLGLWEPGSIYYIGGSDVLPPPLPPAQEQDYLIRMEAGEQEAKSVLIERNLRLVVYIAAGRRTLSWPPTLPGALKTKS